MAFAEFAALCCSCRCVRGDCSGCVCAAARAACSERCHGKQHRNAACTRLPPAAPAPDNEATVGVHAAAAAAPPPRARPFRSTLLWGAQGRNARAVLFDFLRAMPMPRVAPLPEPRVWLLAGRPPHAPRHRAELHAEFTHPAVPPPPPDSADAVARMVVRAAGEATRKDAAVTRCIQDACVQLALLGLLDLLGTGQRNTDEDALRALCLPAEPEAGADADAPTPAPDAASTASATDAAAGPARTVVTPGNAKNILQYTLQKRCGVHSLVFKVESERRPPSNDFWFRASVCLTAVDPALPSAVTCESSKKREAEKRTAFVACRHLHDAGLLFVPPRRAASNSAPIVFDDGGCSIEATLTFGAESASAAAAAAAAPGARTTSGTHAREDAPAAPVAARAVKIARVGGDDSPPPSVWDGDWSVVVLDISGDAAHASATAVTDATAAPAARRPVRGRYALVVPARDPPEVEAVALPACQVYREAAAARVLFERCPCAFRLDPHLHARLRAFSLWFLGKFLKNCNTAAILGPDWAIVALVLPPGSEDWSAPHAELARNVAHVEALLDPAAAGDSSPVAAVEACTEMHMRPALAARVCNRSVVARHNRLHYFARGIAWATSIRNAMSWPPGETFEEFFHRKHGLELKRVDLPLLACVQGGPLEDGEVAAVLRRAAEEAATAAAEAPTAAAEAPTAAAEAAAAAAAGEGAGASSTEMQTGEPPAEAEPPPPAKEQHQQPRSRVRPAAAAHGRDVLLPLELCYFTRLPGDCFWQGLFLPAALQHFREQRVHLRTLVEFQRRFPVGVRNLALLREAFTHPTFPLEKEAADRPTHYERLEFLGDAIVGLACSESLFRRHPGCTEGEFTKAAGRLVSNRHLARVARSLGMLNCLQIAPSQGLLLLDTPSLAADVFEAFVGAVYLDHRDEGLEEAYEAARTVVLDHVLCDTGPPAAAAVVAAAPPPRAASSETTLAPAALRFVHRCGLDTVDPALLREALTLPSSNTETNYERLEWIGDAALKLLAVDCVFLANPSFDEDELSRHKESIVCNAHLCARAEALGFHPAVLVDCEKVEVGEKVPADVLEALLGAVYVRHGLAAAADFAGRRLFPDGSLLLVDWKGKLQNLVQKQLGSTVFPEYVQVRDTAPAAGAEQPPASAAGEAVVAAEVLVNGTPVMRGSGTSRASAEQDAAMRALRALSGEFVAPSEGRART